MTEEQELDETRSETVEPTVRSTRPQRYEVASRCRTRFDRFLRSVLARRLPGTSLSVKGALATTLTAQLDALAATKSIAALADAGITVVKAGAGAGVDDAVLRIKVDPLALRAMYPRSPRLEPHTFVFALDVGGVFQRGASADADDADCDLMHPADGGTRYVGGVCERDELRMQVEVLRQSLGDLGVTLDEGLDELCAGLQSPCESTRARCNCIVRTLEGYGLRFASAQRSWRLPRAGVLLIEDPEALVRAFPSLAFFEPHRFRGLAIVDRPARLGNEVRQGLLF